MTSVSAIGSSDLQPEAAGRRAGAPTPFQYPPSDRVTFNLPSSSSSGITRSFQYPPSDRVTFNLRKLLMKPNPIIFQYPPSDRVTFNFAFEFITTTIGAFSIRHRIE